MTYSSGSENTWLQRAKRHVHVSGAVGHAGYRYGLQRLKGGAPSVDHAQELLNTLGALKGPVMKVAQMLSSIPDALPPEYSRVLSQLQAHAPPMGIPFVRRRMTSELGPHWRDGFLSFDMNACAAASLGQVHRAVSASGQQLACKLQYPYMMAHVEADLQQLRWFCKAYEWSFQTLDTSDIYDEVCDRLREELDYRRECTHLKIFRSLLAHRPDVRIPEPLPELCTSRLLTMTWLEGVPLKEATSWPLEQRNHIARTLFLAWYEPLYSHGFLHSDPHLGNYTLRPDGSVNILDLGCVRLFEVDLIQGILLLYEALQKEDREMAHEAYRLWGFTSLDHELIDVLNQWARLFYEPLLEDRVRPIQKSLSAHEGRKVAENVHKALRRLGGLRPPRAFVFLDRAAVGLGAAFMHLQAENNWHQLFQQCVKSFDPKALLKNQRVLLDHYTL